MFFIGRHYTTGLQLSDIFSMQALAKTPILGGLLIRNTLAFNPGKVMLINPHANQNLTVKNLGGASYVSESMSMELMYLFFNANNFIFESHVKYTYQSSKVDFLADINGTRFGCSVSRVCHWKDLTVPEYTSEFAERHLVKKIKTLNAAQAAIEPELHFNKCLIHIFCQTERLANLFLNHFDRYTNPNLALILTICDHDSIYSDNTEIFEQPFLNYNGSASDS